MDTIRVNLPKKHGWRPEGERRATWFGPGEADIPRGMAEGLVRAGVLKESVLGEGRSLPPFDGYDDLNANDVIDRLQGSTEEERRAVHEYETANKARKTVLEAAHVPGDADASGEQISGQGNPAQGARTAAAKGAGRATQGTD